MQLDNIVSHFAESLHKALLRDLPDVEYRYMSPKQMAERKPGDEGELRRRRPQEREVEIVSFVETWGDTSLGFGGMAGQSMTPALTVVVMSHWAAAVYWDGLLGYVVPFREKGEEADKQRRAFMQALSERSTADQRKAVGLYGARVSTAIR